MIVTNDLKPLYQQGNVTAPHFVMELSMSDWKMMAHFYINLGVYKVATVNKQQIVSYDTIEYVSEIITMKKRSNSNGASI